MRNAVFLFRINHNFHYFHFITILTLYPLCAFFRCLGTPLFGSTFILKTLRAPRPQLYSDSDEVLLATAKYELCLRVRVCKPALPKRLIQDNLNAQDSNCRIWVNNIILCYLFYAQLPPLHFHLPLFF